MSDRLDSWKDIAGYLGREVRTVQRWESERGLPVHRLPGGDKPRVYALKSELGSWLQTSPPEPAAPPSVAVLPFSNLAGDKESEYFSDGLADDIINALTRIRGLRVTARTSSFAFRGQEKDVRRIGEELGVASLLEGSVRRAGNRVRVSAQLVSASDGFHIWSDTYDRSLTDIFAIQDEIAHSIAAALRVRLTPEPVVPQYTDDPAVYDLWLKGRCAAADWTPRGLAQAQECFTAAMARDPKFPLPYVALAEMMLEGAWFGFVEPLRVAPRAKGLVLQALALDAGLADGHAVLGSIESSFEYQWEAAERSFGRALEIAPGSPSVLGRHGGYFLAPQRRFPQALAEMRGAVSLDPLSPTLHTLLGLVLLLARDYPGAERHCRKAAQLVSSHWAARWFLGTALAAQGRGDEAAAEFRFGYELLRSVPLTIAAMCVAYGLLGRTEEARQSFDEFEVMSKAGPEMPFAAAWAYLGVGDDRVFSALDKAIDARVPGVTYLPSLFIYDRLRPDPRFGKLLEKMRLD